MNVWGRKLPSSLNLWLLLAGNLGLTRLSLVKQKASNSRMPQAGRKNSSAPPGIATWHGPATSEAAKTQDRDSTYSSGSRINLRTIVTATGA